MKITKITLFLSLIFPILGQSQSNDNFFLEWKIKKNDTIKYKTIMNPVQVKDEISENKDLNSVFSGKDFKEMQKLVSDMNSSLKYETKLYLNNKNDKFIDIVMNTINEEKSDSKSDLNELMSQMEKESKKKKGKKSKEEIDTLSMKKMMKGISALNNNVVLRGRLSSKGEIISNYYKNSQKNLIAILFELPNKEVKIGEKWKLNVNFIEMDQNFICDSLYNENFAFIEKVIDSNNEKIAVIKYQITEFVSGDFNNPMTGFLGSEKEDAERKTYLKASHTATANFSITKGKWITYDGALTVENNVSFLGGKSKTEFKLLE